MTRRRRNDQEMVVELMQDLQRDSAYWLVVDNSEQSFVDLADPAHLEFEYVQMMAYVVQSAFPEDVPLTALHLGGGLCTVPRWVAELYPGSTQQVAENSPEIAGMARSLGGLETVADLVVADAMDVVEATPAGSLDLLVCDVYEGPETVTSVFALPALQRMHDALRADGWYVCNLSDAAPFRLAKVVVATLSEVFDGIVMLAEPAVLRGRRSGNVVLGATDSELPLDSLRRSAAAGPLRARVVSGEDLRSFAGDAGPAHDASQLPESGESVGLRLL
jgi:spermidine synthase